MSRPFVPQRIIERTVNRFVIIVKLFLRNVRILAEVFFCNYTISLWVYQWSLGKEKPLSLICYLTVPLSRLVLLRGTGREQENESPVAVDNVNEGGTIIFFKKNKGRLHFDW